MSFCYILHIYACQYSNDWADWAWENDFVKPTLAALTAFAYQVLLIRHVTAIHHYYYTSSSSNLLLHDFNTPLLLYFSSCSAMTR